jgi:hypothetical protein
MNGLDVKQQKEYVITPTLALMPLKYQGLTSVNLLAGIMLVESGGIYVRQLDGGPAHGVCQMEQATHDDCWSNFLNFPENAQVRNTILSFIGTLPQNKVENLDGNLFYAYLMARIKLYRAPDPLPMYNDAIGMANYHKNWYNTAGGATQVSQSKLLFQEAIDA